MRFKEHKVSQGGEQSDCYDSIVVHFRLEDLRGVKIAPSSRSGHKVIFDYDLSHTEAVIPYVCHNSTLMPFSSLVSYEEDRKFLKVGRPVYR